jgi:hypothetical protein
VIEMGDEPTKADRVVSPAMRALRLLWKRPGDFALALRMVGFILASAVLVRLTSVPRALRFLVRRPGARPLGAAEIERRVALLDGVIGVLKRDAPFLSPTCWERAIVLQRILAAGGLPADVALGLRPGPRGAVEGHAWVEREGAPLFEPEGPGYRAAFVFKSPIA